VGDGVVFIGNRAGAQVCAFDNKALSKRGCVTLASTPDGLQWWLAIVVVAASWATPAMRRASPIGAGSPGGGRVADEPLHPLKAGQLTWPRFSVEGEA